MASIILAKVRRSIAKILNRLYKRFIAGTIAMSIEARYAPKPNFHRFHRPKLIP